jgi:hypothetical protein
MQISGGTHPRYRYAANSKHGTCCNSVSAEDSAALRKTTHRAIASAQQG